MKPSKAKGAPEIIERADASQSEVDMRDYSTPEVKSFTTTGVSVGSVEVSRDDMIRWFQEHADHDSLLLMDTALSVGFDRLAPETNIADVLSSMSTLRSLIEGVA